MLAAEQFLISFAHIVKGLLGPRDIAGHLGGTTLLLLLERGNPRDVEAWCENLLERVGKHLFPMPSGAGGLHASCSIGLAMVSLAGPDLNAAVMDALGALRRGRERGGAQVIAVDRADNDARVKGYDQVWVKHIRAALMENRFRLVQQPIASLHGRLAENVRRAVRMLDAQGKEVLPSEFLAAASRNDLMKNIDRWVVGASLSFTRRTSPICLFVRLSRDSARDASLAAVARVAAALDAAQIHSDCACRSPRRSPHQRARRSTR